MFLVGTGGDSQQGHQPRLPSSWLRVESVRPEQGRRMARASHPAPPSRGCHSEPPGAGLGGQEGPPQLFPGRPAAGLPRMRGARGDAGVVCATQRAVGGEGTSAPATGLRAQAWGRLGKRGPGRVALPALCQRAPPLRLVTLTGVGAGRCPLRSGRRAGPPRLPTPPPFTQPLSRRHPCVAEGRTL